MAVYRAKPPAGALLHRGHPAAKKSLCTFLVNEAGGTVLRDTADKRNGTLNNFAATGSKSSGWFAGSHGRALWFDGSDDYVTVTNPSTTYTRVTVEVLFTFDSGANGDSRLVEKGANTEWVLALKTNAGTWDIALYNNFTTPSASYAAGIAAGTLTSGLTYHVVATIAADGYARIYLNGVLKGTASASGGVPSGARSGNLEIGRYSPGGPYYGKFGLHYLRVADYAATATEIRRLAADPFRPFRPRRLPVPVRPSGGNTAYTADLSGSLTPSGAIAKAVAQPRTGTLTNTGSLTRASAQTRTGSLTTSGAITKASAKPLTGTATTGGTLTKATSQTRTGSVTLSGLLTRATAKGLTGTLSLTGSLTKAIAKALAGSVTPSGAFVAGSLFTKALTGAVTLTGAGVVKATAKTVTGTVTASGSVLRAIAKALTGLLSLTGLFSKSGGSGDLADLPPGGVIRRADTRRVIRPVAPPGRVVRRADTRRTFPD